MGAVRNKINSFLKFDYLLFFPIVILYVFSLLTLYDFSDNKFFIKQAIFGIFAIGMFLVFSKIDFTFLKNTKIIMSMYVVSLVLLVLTILIGQNINGAKAWLNLGFFSFQPADSAKLVFIILLAKYFSKRHVEIKFLRHILISLFYVILPIIIIMKQPDLGSAIVLGFIWFFVVLLAGMSKKHLAIFVFIGITGSIIAWNVALKPYQKDRIFNFVNPMRDIQGSGYNVYQALVAIGSGGVTGKDVGFGTQSKLHFLPEHETDFIFSAFAEEWGFMGVSILFILYFILLARVLYVAHISNDNFFAVISLGVFAWIFIHTFINISMNMGLFPVTGLPLPFMSYGGSHLLMLAIALGMVSSFTQSKKNTAKKRYTEFMGY